MLLKMLLLKNTVYDKLAAKVNNIDTSTSTQYQYTSMIHTKQNYKRKFLM